MAVSVYFSLLLVCVFCEVCFYSNLYGRIVFSSILAIVIVLHGMGRCLLIQTVEAMKLIMHFVYFTLDNHMHCSKPIRI